MSRPSKVQPSQAAMPERHWPPEIWRKPAASSSTGSGATTLALGISMFWRSMVMEALSENKFFKRDRMVEKTANGANFSQERRVVAVERMPHATPNGAWLILARPFVL